MGTPRCLEKEGKEVLPVPELDSSAGCGENHGETLVRLLFPSPLLSCGRGG